MFVLRRLPAFLALLLLGALSLRLSLALPVAAVLLLASLILLFIPGRATQLLMATLLWGGCLAWIGMAWLRVSQRLAEGQPWMRLALIFLGVAVFTAWAAWLLRPPQPVTGAEPK